MIFSKNNFALVWVYVLSSISRTLHNFPTGYLSMYRGIIQLKIDSSILHKNDSFTNKTCCGLSALFVKTKIYLLFCCNFGNKQIKKILALFLRIDCSQYVKHKILQKTFVLLEIEHQINGHLLKMSLHNMTNWQTLIYCKIDNCINYQVIYMPPWSRIFDWIFILVKHAERPYYILNGIRKTPIRKIATDQTPTVKLSLKNRHLEKSYPCF